MTYFYEDAKPGAYIRRFYGVPARIGQRVAFTWRGYRPGVITGFDNQGIYLRIKFDDGGGKGEKYHPTWEIEYLPLDIVKQDDVSSEGQTPPTQETRTH